MQREVKFACLTVSRHKQKVVMFEIQCLKISALTITLFTPRLTLLQIKRAMRYEKLLSGL